MNRFLNFLKTATPLIDFIAAFVRRKRRERQERAAKERAIEAEIALQKQAGINAGLTKESELRSRTVIQEIGHKP